MELKKQCVSLELAKKLKQLGFDQCSLFYYYMDEIKMFSSFEYPPSGREIHFTDKTWTNNFFTVYSAYTSAELGEILPPLINYEITPDKLYQSMSSEYSALGGKWSITYWEQKGDKHINLVSDTEADARAKMIIYLHDKKII